MGNLRNTLALTVFDVATRFDAGGDHQAKISIVLGRHVHSFDRPCGLHMLHRVPLQPLVQVQLQFW